MAMKAASDEIQRAEQQIRYEEAFQFAAFRIILSRFTSQADWRIKMQEYADLCWRRTKLEDRIKTYKQY